MAPIALTVVAVVVLAACASDGDGAPGSTTEAPQVAMAPGSTAPQASMPPTTTPVTTASPTSVSSSTTLPSEADGPPPMDLTGTDFRRIYEDLLGFQDWLAATNTTDPETLTMAIDPAGPYWRMVVDGAEAREELGYSLRPGEWEIVAFGTPIVNLDAGIVEGSFILRTLTESVLHGPDGQTVATIPADGLANRAFVLVRSPDGRWRLHTQELPR